MINIHYICIILVKTKLIEWKLIKNKGAKGNGCVVYFMDLLISVVTTAWLCSCTGPRIFLETSSITNTTPFVLFEYLIEYWQVDSILKEPTPDSTTEWTPSYPTRKLQQKLTLEQKRFFVKVESVLSRRSLNWRTFASSWSGKTQILARRNSKQDSELSKRQRSMG